MTQKFEAQFGRRTLLAGGAAVGGVVALGALNPGHALAAGVARPPIITTSEWGAKPARAKLTTYQRRPHYLVIHNTAYPNSSDYSEAAAKAKARQIQQDHFARSFVDTGQQFTVTRGKHILEGRHGSLAALIGGKSFVEGSQAKGANADSVGIETDGNFNVGLPTQPQYQSLVWLAAFICQQYQIPVANIIGHRDAGSSNTDCPGKLFYPKLQMLRDDVAATLRTGTVTASPIGSAPGPAPSGTDYPLLKQGAKGEAVTRLQNLLAAAGHSVGKVDGVFGAATLAAVKAFQTKIATDVDGVVGPRSWGALETFRASGTLVKQGSSGDQVSYLQRGLNATIDARLGVDGKFGAGTRAAVVKYQQNRKLSADGVAGKDTWAKLKSGR